MRQPTLRAILALAFGLFSYAQRQPTLTASQEKAQASQVQVSSPYHPVRTVPLPFLKHLRGEFLFEPVSRRLFVPDGKNLIEINPGTGEMVGVVKKIGRVSAIAFAPDLHEGFAVNSDRGGIEVFDLETLTILQKIHSGGGASLAVYNPATKEVITASGYAKDCRVFDPLARKFIKTVKLGGYPLGGVADAEGRLYFEFSRDALPYPLHRRLEIPVFDALLPSATEIAKLDGRNLVMTNLWKEPCKPMHLLGVDETRQRLIAQCGGSVVAINAETGNFLTSTRVAGGPLLYLHLDEVTSELFALSPRHNALIVLHENSAAEFGKPALVARGLNLKVAFDDKRGQIFILTGDQRLGRTIFGDQVISLPEPVPGTFRIEIYGKN